MTHPRGRPPRGGSPNVDGVAREAAWLDRNREVLDMLRQGLSVREIARQEGKSKSSIGKIRGRLRDLGQLETGA